MKKEEPFKSYSNIIFSGFKETPWPCYVSPLNDELFSSWLMRIARNHLVRFYSFCSSNFSGAEFWNRDLDRILPDLIRSKVKSKSIITEERIDQMLLNSYSPNLFTSSLVNKSFWITQLNFYTNRKHNFGLAACPKCIKTDEAPYYRKVWRSSLSTVCPNCGIKLIDRCPNCSSPINFLLGERGKKYQAPLFPITSCWKCLYNLSDTSTTKASQSLIDIQTKLNKFISEGHVMDRQLQYSHLYFDVLKKILSLLNKADSAPLIKMQELICRDMQLEFNVPADNRLNTFNTLPINTRGNLIHKAYWLLDEWPYRFRSITQSSGVKSKLLLNDFRECPYWFHEEISLNNKLVFAGWRKSHPEYSYSSFNEFAFWQVSKLKKSKAAKTK